MIRFIFAWFGYVKVPKEAVRMALHIEDVCKVVRNRVPGDQPEILLRMASTIREFLQTGRMVQ